MTDLNQWKKQTIYNTVSLEHTVLSLSLLRRLLLPKSVVRGCHALVHPLRGHGCGAVTAERLPRLHKLQITSRSHFDVAAQAHGIHTSWRPRLTAIGVLHGQREDSFRSDIEHHRGWDIVLVDAKRRRKTFRRLATIAAAKNECKSAHVACSFDEIRSKRMRLVAHLALVEDQCREALFTTQIGANEFLPRVGNPRRES